MMEKNTNPTPHRKRVRFALYAPNAGTVQLAGNFNQWNGQKHVMSTDGQGIWKKTILLSPGIYEYKFLVDGNWQEDPANHQSKLNTFGSRNNWLKVL